MSRFRPVIFLSSALLLTGCGLTSVSRQAQIAPTTTQIGGSVHGGNQPVTNATVQLWQVGNIGYGSAPSQLGSSVTSGVGGNFSLTGQYSCSSAANGNNTFVYLTATGGNPGFADPTTNNTALVMMAALGYCGSLTPNTFTTINEVSTVAAVYALQQFMNSSGGIGSFSSYTTGLANAFATVNTLINTTTGTARSTAVPGTNVNVLPTATLNTLANILVPCVNSASSSASNCTSLFAAATPPTGGAPANTLTAALDIALNPVQINNSSYISNLFNLSTTNPAFQPILSAAPNDFTLSVGYAQGGNPNSLAIDSIGNVWTTAGSGTASSVTEMSTLGVPATNSPFNNSSFNGAYGLALDTGGNAYVTNSSGNSVMQLQLLMNAINSVGVYNNIGLSSPQGIMVDSNNNLWIANSAGNSVTEFNSISSLLQQYTAGGLSAPVALASDLTGNTWVANSTGGSITSIPQFGGSSAGYAPHTGGGLSTPSALAIDAGGYIWVTDSLLSEVAEIDFNGNPVTSNTGDTGGGLTSSFADAIDGGDNIWVADYAGNRLTKLLPAGQSGAPATPSTGILGGLGSPKSLAIDGSGNIWVGNSAPVNGATITEFIGLASPANAPLVAGLQTGGIGTRPGTVNIGPGFTSPAELGIFYTNTFTATGGSGNYSWSITSGLSALQAIGLTFTAAGTLSGTPTSTVGSTFTFTVQVYDTTTSTSASQIYTLQVNTPPATSCTHDNSGNSILSGHYAFLLTGFDPNGHFYDEIGSFKADGAGNLTNGDADVNGDQNLSAFASGEQQFNFTGTYAIGSTDDRGMLNFVNSNGTGTAGLPTNTSFCFAADQITSGVAYSGRLIQADGSGYMLTGFFNIQNNADFAPSAITGGYAFGLQGVDGTTPNRRGMIGQFTANGAGGITSGQFDTSGVNYNSGTSTYVNSYSATNAMSAGTYTLGANGRGNITFNVGGVAMPFVVYMTGNGTQLFLLSQNASSSATTPLLAGKALIQLTSTYTTASVAGDGVFRGNGTTDPNSPPLADAGEVGQFTFDGAGNATFIADSNTGGNISPASSNVHSGTYTVSSPGYLQIGGGSNAPNFYLFAPGGGFGLDNTNNVGFYYMVPQTIPSGGFTNANLSTNLTGSYALGTVFPSAYNISNMLLENGAQYPSIFSAEINFTSGAFTVIQDAVEAPGTPASLYVTADVTLTGTYMLDPTYGPTSGRFLLQQNSQNIVVGYIVNPTQAFLVTIQSGQNPQLVESDHH